MFKLKHMQSRQNRVMNYHPASKLISIPGLTLKPRQNPSLEWSLSFTHQKPATPNGNFYIHQEPQEIATLGKQQC